MDEINTSADVISTTTEVVTETTKIEMPIFVGVGIALAAAATGVAVSYGVIKSFRYLKNRRAAKREAVAAENVAEFLAAVKKAVANADELDVKPDVSATDTGVVGGENVTHLLGGRDVGDTKTA